MPNYLSSINQIIASAVAKVPKICLYGQNINTGTYISGLSKNLAVQDSGKIINTANCENTLCGLGFGLMLNGVPSVYFVKQLDFMLLGLDHFVNTYNFIRCSRDPNLGSFTIIMFVCDQGMQGPQSSLNSFGDFSSLARIPCYTLTNSRDAASIINTQLNAPGFRMIALSSRLAKSEFLQLETVYAAEDLSVFQYTEGDEATIACFNFSLPEGYLLYKKLLEKGIASSLFSVNYVPRPNWEQIKKSVARTKKLVVIDDSKSVHLPAYTLLYEINETVPSFRKIIVTRESDISFSPSTDNLKIDFDSIISRLVS